MTPRNSADGSTVRLPARANNQFWLREIQGIASIWLDNLDIQGILLVLYSIL